MKLLNFDNVLCLSPHSDDVEFSMGGTILKYNETKFYSIVFSTGSIYDHISDEERFKECECYWKDVSNITLRLLSKDLNRHNDEEWIVAIEKEFDLKKFDAIFIPSKIDSHYEHRKVHDIGMALTRKHPISLVEYKSPSTLEEWVPNLFCDIEYQVKDKNKRLLEFKSQNKLYFQEKYLESFHGTPSCVKKNIYFSEPFKIKFQYLRS